jgi:hypothetical protein
MFLFAISRSLEQSEALLAAEYGIQQPLFEPIYHDEARVTEQRYVKMGIGGKDKP